MAPGLFPWDVVPRAQCAQKPLFWNIPAQEQVMDTPCSSRHTAWPALALVFLFLHK